MFLRAPTLPDGAKKLELRARGRVRLFGVTLENATGAVVDNLGVVNATAKAMRNHNLDEHWRNQLAHRAPDLVVVMYGTNEAEWLAPNGAGMAEHEKIFGELLATIRAAVAESVVPRRVAARSARLAATRKLPPRESIPAMVEAQHRAATRERLRVLGHLRLDGRQRQLGRLVQARPDRQRLPAPDERRRRADRGRPVRGPHGPIRNAAPVQGAALRTSQLTGYCSEPFTIT